ncbi:MAG: helix-turn-helix transcriptional regulator [Pseudomonadota bacterium]
MKRRETIELFQNRLSEVIARSQLSRSAFADRAGIDRSTLSQLLSTGNTRLPRAETLASIAAREQVSVDWLLGLSQEDHLATKIVTESLEIQAGGEAAMDEVLERWQKEAEGYKIRYVPTTLPDLLKTDEVIAFEFQSAGQDIRESQMGQAEERLDYSRRPDTDIEACSAFQSVESFARGEGIWRRMPVDMRVRQLRAMIELIDELYPTFRWFLFDGLRRFASPYTVFGPTRAAIYLGGMFFVFNSTEHIRVLARHFDSLIRAAIYQPPDVKPFLEQLLMSLEDRR